MRLYENKSQATRIQVELIYRAQARNEWLSVMNIVLNRGHFRCPLVPLDIPEALFDVPWSLWPFLKPFSMSPGLFGHT